MDLKNKHILITQLRLFDFAGSEIVTLELAEEFSRRGAIVSVMTGNFGEPIVREFRKIQNVTLYGVNDPNFVKMYERQPVDIAWIHHQIIPDVVLENYKNITFIFNHMSAMLGVEMPLFYRLEDRLADKIIFNSQETRDNVASQGYVRKDDDRLGILYNAAPKRFIDTTFSRNEKLQRVGIVSNHIPEEAEEALRILETRHGVSVLRFGAHSEIRKRIEPADIEKCDVIFTIGKTVQYAIVGSRPVYCYDNFGGPGYLNEGNLELAMRRNFSGRGFDRRSAATIAHEIIEGYEDARMYAEQLRKKLQNTICLEARIDKIIQSATRHNKQKESLDEVMLASYKALRDLVVSGLSRSAHIEKQLQAEVQDLKDVVASVGAQNKTLEEEIRAIKHSVSYRLGNKIAYPVRFIKIQLQKFK